MLDKSSEGAGKDKSLREQERRRKKYKFALVKWSGWETAGLNRYAVEYKENLLWKASFTGHPEILCDWEPERVLKGMLKLLKENEDG